MLREMWCAVCDVNFGLTQRFWKERQEDGRTFYCPNGHPVSFHDTELDRLRRENQRLAKFQPSRDGRGRFVPKEK